VLDSNVPAYMYGLDVFNRITVDHDVAIALEHGDDPLGRVVGSLLGHRVALSEDESAEYTGLIGDAGAVCSIVDPLALRTEVRRVRVELSGYGRGQTLVDLRRFAGEDVVHGLADEWANVEIALEADAERITRLFLDTLGLSG
jgi:pyrimidine-specific ribonucleoside hydrolase